MADARALLLRLLAHLEAEPQPVGKRERRHLRREIRRCRAALVWNERREEISSPYLWREVGLRYAAYLWTGAVFMLVLSPRHHSVGFATLWLGGMACFSVAGGALVGRMGYAGSERQYRQQLERATAVLGIEGSSARAGSLADGSA